MMAQGFKGLIRFIDRSVGDLLSWPTMYSIITHTIVFENSEKYSREFYAVSGELMTTGKTAELCVPV